jgi:uncharacterized membrane protein (DUF106 family)
MRMLDLLNWFLVTVTDYVLGWTLHMPRFAVLVLVAVGEAVTITYIQKWTTNQDKLKRMKHDKARLKQLIKEAMKRGDKEAVKRYRQTGSSIATTHMRMELLPIVVSLVPIIFLATWAFARLGYLPPQKGSPVIVKAYFPSTEIGKLVHILPQQGLEATSGWIQKIGDDKDKSGKLVGGMAAWDLKCTDAGGRFMLTIRCNGKAVQKELLVDGRKYADPLVFYSGSGPTGVKAVELAMPEYKPLGIVPGIPWLTFPPWLVGDLMMVIPLSLLLKPLLKIY